MITDLTTEQVRRLFTYDPETGQLIWQKRYDISARCDRKTGKVAGFIDQDGYCAIYINYKRYPSHCIIWALVTGEWPVNDIDHINGIRSDNRWINLRTCTRQENLRNMRLRPTNKSGFKWVSWCKAANKWRAQIRDGNTNKYLGIYNTPEEAYDAACQAASALHKEFANFG